MSALQIETEGPIYSHLSSDRDLADLVAQYVEQIPLQMDELRQLFDGDNLAELQRSVHRIKGTAGSYGFDHVTPAAAHLEKTICLGSHSEVELALRELTTICLRLRAGGCNSAAVR